jgi:hypothetical protein
MKPHPYGVTGPCERCRTALASSRCESHAFRPMLLCWKCADAYMDAVFVRLAA